MTFGYSGVDAGALPAPALPGAATYASATADMDMAANGPSRRMMRAMKSPLPRERPTLLHGQLGGVVFLFRDLTDRLGFIRSQTQVASCGSVLFELLRFLLRLGRVTRRKLQRLLGFD